MSNTPPTEKALAYVESLLEEARKNRYVAPTDSRHASHEDGRVSALNQVKGYLQHQLERNEEA